MIQNKCANISSDITYWHNKVNTSDYSKKEKKKKKKQKQQHQNTYAKPLSNWVESYVESMKTDTQEV